MINISFQKTEDKITLKVRGHAGAAKAGMDIICAAVSILAYTLAQTSIYMYENKKLLRKPYISMEAGNAVITICPSPDSYTEALHSYFIAEIGFSLLAQSYPKYVKIQSILGQA